MNTINKPTYHEHEDFVLRQEKLRELEAMGVEPYPHEFRPTAFAQALEETHTDQQVGTSDEAAEGKTPHVSVAGRLVLFRAMGKNAFAHIQDETGRMQIMLNRDHATLHGYTPGPDDSKAIKVIEKKIDLGDIVGVEGHLFRTQKGELTLFVKTFTLLCKTLLPLPDKHAGLADKEIRYRKRWLDLICHPDIQETFRKRSRILKLIRTFMDNEHFMEVETPILQGIYGGAEARPFTTKLNALDQEMFLRISLEIPLKKLITGGMGKIFEMGKVFRNEGIDRSHNPEFTLMEAYAPYWDYTDMMSLVERLFEHLALKLNGVTQITLPYRGEDVVLEMKAPWPRLSMKEAILTFANIDVDTLSDDQLRTMLKKSEHVAPDRLSLLSRGLLIAALFEVYAEPKLIQPHHIIDHPIETTPLCKPHRSPEHLTQGLVERFESFILGSEICNAYTELNDPLLQRQLLEVQAARRESGDEEASPLDEEFIEAVCQGMPPTGGVGIGIDRLVMLFTGTHSIRDVLYFPWMKEKTL
ncbi:MAG: lysine--tRNA ligase [Chlamydiia bacterium]|nr:lysine--tRNA ligase [Chlamydiia bacterium]